MTSCCALIEYCLSLSVKEVDHLALAPHFTIPCHKQLSFTNIQLCTSHGIWQSTADHAIRQRASLRCCLSTKTPRPEPPIAAGCFLTSSDESRIFILPRFCANGPVEQSPRQDALFLPSLYTPIGMVSAMASSPDRTYTRTETMKDDQERRQRDVWNKNHHHPTTKAHYSTTLI